MNVMYWDSVPPHPWPELFGSLWTSQLSTTKLFRTLNQYTVAKTCSHHSFQSAAVTGGFGDQAGFPLLSRLRSTTIGVMLWALSCPMMVAALIGGIPVVALQL